MFNSSFSGMSVYSLSKAKDFYTNILGCKILSESMGLTLELPGGNKLFIYEKQDHTPATFTVLNFEVSDINSAAADLRSKGVVFEHYEMDATKPDENGIFHSPDKAKYGPSIAWFKDPAGNIIALLES